MREARSVAACSVPGPGLTVRGVLDAVQFHTGLGDNDIVLSRASPAEMQPLIKAYPNTKIVLLHSSYPFTREAGYLTAVYANVFLDFGEVFPFVSAEGQAAVVRQVLELSPTNKIMWSSTFANAGRMVDMFC